MDIGQLLFEFNEKLPHFSDGRIDYSHADRAVVMSCFVQFQGEILLLKRSSRVREYKNKWHGVGGYVDRFVKGKDMALVIREKALEELSEELGIVNADIKHITIAECFEFKDVRIGKTWYVNPVLAELKRKPKIQLDWEHTEFAWIHPSYTSQYDTVPSFSESLSRALP